MSKNKNRKPVERHQSVHQREVTESVTSGAVKRRWCPMPEVLTLVLTLLFFVTYVIVLGTMYPCTLRMMEANCWIDDWVLQFFRWPWVGACIMGGVISLVMLAIAVLLRLVHLRKFMPLSLLVALGLAYFYPPTADFAWGQDRLFSFDMRERERIFNYALLTDQKDWKSLRLALTRNHAQENEIGCRYLLLAASAQGTLTEDLFSTPINSTEQFLFRGYRNSISCTFNRQFYENLGIWDEAYHQAQEYAMCQRDFCFYSVCQMVDYSIAEAEWAVAEKLLTVLDQALFYHDFVKDRRARIAEGRKAKPCNDAPIRQDNFVTGYSLQNEMVHDIQYYIGDTLKEQEYVACCMLLRKKVEQFCYSFPALTRYHGMSMEQLPSCFQEAFQINASRGEALHDAPRGTYAYFFYNTQIPEVEPRFQGSATN